MTNTISSKPNYAIPFANLKFEEGTKENYKNGYWQTGKSTVLSGNYEVSHGYNLPDEKNIITTLFDGENKYGEPLKKQWRKYGDDTIEIEKEKL